MTPRRRNSKTRFYSTQVYSSVGEGREVAMGFDSRTEENLDPESFPNKEIHKNENPPWIKREKHP